MKASDLRGILNYVPRYRDKVFVISMDGEVLANHNFSTLLLDIAVLWSLGIKIVLVHGISYQLVHRASELAVPITSSDGTGVTSDATLDLSITVANRLTHEIMEGLTSSDIRSIYPNAIISHPVGVLDGVDQLFTGKVERVDAGLLEKIVRDEIVPVIPPLGFDGDGRTYRVNSDAVAFFVAKALSAVKLIFVTPNDKLTRGGELISQLAVQEAQEYHRAYLHEIPANLRSKVEYGIRACNEGVSRVHLVNGNVDEALLGEVFLNEGIGTMIYANEYQAIRSAMKKDVPTILKLIKQSVDSSELVKRTRASIVQQLGDYFVFEMDRNIVACVALHCYPENNAGELACLFVSDRYENAGIGRKLVAFVEKTAREKGMDTLFALSTQAFAFFRQKGGFIEASPEELPQSRREKWEGSGRNSKILFKRLSQPKT